MNSVAKEGGVLQLVVEDSFWEYTCILFPLFGEIICFRFVRKDVTI